VAGTKLQTLAAAREEKVQRELVGWCDCNWLKKICLQFLTKQHEILPQGYSAYTTEGRRKKERIKVVGLCRIFYLKTAFLKISLRIACVRVC